LRGLGAQRGTGMDALKNPRNQERWRKPEKSPSQRTSLAASDVAKSRRLALAVSAPARKSVSVLCDCIDIIPSTLLQKILLRLSAGRHSRLLSPCRTLKTVGTKSNVDTVANISPPMTARPRGAFCSPPSPSPKAIGSIPMIMAKAVISTGRKRVNPDSRAAVIGSLPAANCSAAKTHHQDAIGGRNAHAHDGAGERRHA